MVPAYAALCLGTAVELPFNAALGAIHVMLLLWSRPGWVTSLRGALYPLAALVAAAFLSPWGVSLWLCVLAGLALGRAVANDDKGRLEVSEPVLELTFALVLLFFLAVPQALGVFDSQPVALLVVVGLAGVAWAGAAVVMAGWREPGQTEPVVTMLATLLCLVLALTVVCAHLLTSDGGGSYDYLAVTLVVVTAGCGLAVVAWMLWNPYLGGGIADLFFRHVMSLAMPFDAWREDLVAVARSAADAREFWAEAMARLVAGTSVLGIIWQEDGQDRMVGMEGGHEQHLSLVGMDVTVSSARRLRPTELLNIWLLARIAAEHRQAKAREGQLATEARLKTVHELGARTTHDIKNLLQAINLLCRPARSVEGEKEFTATKREQLLMLAGRLETTLARLKGDGIDERESLRQPVADWWERVCLRNDHAGVTFAATADALAGNLPPDLFDRALENLLHNSLRKTGTDGALEIKVELSAGPVLTVRDNGPTIPAEMADRLFHAPVPSSTGMGIGLYQLALSARRLGFRMFVSANEPGDVAVTLAIS